VPISANGQLAFGGYLGDARHRWGAFEIQVLALNADARVSDVTSFHNPEVFARFGLPAELAA
jgi:hypothetical protein